MVDVPEAFKSCVSSCAGYFRAVQAIHPVIIRYFTISIFPTHILSKRDHGCHVKVSFDGDHTSFPSQSVPPHLTPTGRLKPVEHDFYKNSDKTMKLIVV